MFRFLVMLSKSCGGLKYLERNIDSDGAAHNHILPNIGQALKTW
jgi:hypothetical protein